MNDAPRAAVAADGLRLAVRHPDAERVLRDALSAHPGDGILLIVLAAVLRQTERPEEALAAAGSAAAQLPEAASAIASRHGAAYRESLRLDPESADAMGGLAALDLDAGRGVQFVVTVTAGLRARRNLRRSAAPPP